MNYGGRTTAMGYQTNPALTQRFTGKERDAETGLDYFGARYLSSVQGRWPSPDAPFADQHLADPQSWNLYSYVRNNPIGVIDDDGRASIKADRDYAVAQAWKQEKALVERTGRGTREWTAAEKAELLRTGKVSGYQGHHINNVANNPEMARDPNNVDFRKGGGRGSEHWKVHHEGRYRKPKSGALKVRGLAAFEALGIAAWIYADMAEAKSTGIVMSYSPFHFGPRIVDPIQAAQTLDGQDIIIFGDQERRFHVTNGRFVDQNCRGTQEQCSVDPETLKGQNFAIIPPTV